VNTRRSLCAPVFSQHTQRHNQILFALDGRILDRIPLLFACLSCATNSRYQYHWGPRCCQRNRHITHNIITPRIIRSTCITRFSLCGSWSNSNFPGLPTAYMYSKGVRKLLSASCNNTVPTSAGRARARRASVLSSAPSKGNKSCGLTSLLPTQLARYGSQDTPFSSLLLHY
jgi:hypothetical protein